MTEVTFKVNGEEKKITLKPGDRIFDGAYRLQLDEQGFGECGGNCACATCHVYVVEGGEGFKKPSIDEEDLLDTVDVFKPTSRLGCQLVITDQEKIVVEVPDA